MDTCIGGAGGESTCIMLRTKMPRMVPDDKIEDPVEELPLSSLIIYV